MLRDLPTQLLIENHIPCLFKGTESQIWYKGVVYATIHYAVEEYLPVLVC